MFWSFSVELLAYKVEQEKCIASDLQKTLSKEQDMASDVRRLLAVEQSAAQDLKSENTRLLESVAEAQRESLQLRYAPAAPVLIVSWVTGRTSPACCGRLWAWVWE